MTSTISRVVRPLGLLAVLALASTVALVAAPGEGEAKRGPLYLISGPVQVEAGEQLRAAIVNLGKKTLHAQVAFIDVANGVYEREQEAEIHAGRMGTVDFVPSSDFVGVVQITLDPRPTGGSYRAGLIGAGGAGLAMVYRYSAEDVASAPIPR